MADGNSESKLIFALIYLSFEEFIQYQGIRVYAISFQCPLGRQAVAQTTIFMSDPQGPLSQRISTVLLCLIEGLRTPVLLQRHSNARGTGIRFSNQPPQPNPFPGPCCVPGIWTTAQSSLQTSSPKLSKILPGLRTLGLSDTLSILAQHSIFKWREKGKGESFFPPRCSQSSVYPWHAENPGKDKTLRSLIIFCCKNVFKQENRTPAKRVRVKSRENPGSGPAACCPDGNLSIAVPSSSGIFKMYRRKLSIKITKQMCQFGVNLSFSMFSAQLFLFYFPIL